MSGKVPRVRQASLPLGARVRPGRDGKRMCVRARTENGHVSGPPYLMLYRLVPLVGEPTTVLSRRPVQFRFGCGFE